MAPENWRLECRCVAEGIHAQCAPFTDNRRKLRRALSPLTPCLTMSVSTPLRRYWEITVRYAHHLQEMTASPGFMAIARRCPEVTGDRPHLEAAAQQAYDGITRSEMDAVEAARQSYHIQMLNDWLSELKEQVLSLTSGGRLRKTYRLSQLDSSANRSLLCKAVHDTTDWQYRDPEEVDDEKNITFEVWRLEQSEINELTRRSMRASHHETRLDTLEEVRRQVNGKDQYEAPSPLDDSSSLDGSLSDAAAEAIEDAVDDARPSNEVAASHASAPADPNGLEGDLDEMADTIKMIYDEVEGTSDKRYLNAEEAGEILGIEGKTVLNRSGLPEDDDRYIPSLTLPGSDRKRFDREVIERLLKASDR